MYVELDTSDNSTMAHPLINIMLHLSPYCVVFSIEVFVSLGMILAVSDHNLGVVTIRGMFCI